MSPAYRTAARKAGFIFVSPKAHRRSKHCILAFDSIRISSSFAIRWMRMQCMIISIHRLSFSILFEFMILRFGEEQRTGGFPFTFNQQFKLAIAITDRDFRLAVNGHYHSSFLFRTFNQLDKLNSFRVGVSYGMHIEITGVDHLPLGPSGHENFAVYSSPNATIF